MAEVELFRAAGRAGELPQVCMYCGSPAVTKRQKVFIGTTPITMFMGAGIPRVKLPICEHHGWLFVVRHKLALIVCGLATIALQNDKQMPSR